MQPPLILTLDIEQQSLDYFTQLCQTYFPRERNYLQAHLTLFHKLPDIDEIDWALLELSGQHQPFELDVANVVSLGNGVAFKFESKKLIELHKTLQTAWLSMLSNQDKHSLWPHITVQNKVESQIAKRTLLELSQNFMPFKIKAWPCFMGIL